MRGSGKERVRQTVRQRLLSGLIIEWETGCLLWDGQLDRCGYGRFQAARRTRSVHSVAWELEYGPVPEGLELDHVWAWGCRNRNCANVAHMEPVTHAENLRRQRDAMRIEGRSTRGYTRPFHCHHADTPENVYTAPSGARACRPCRRAASARSRAKKKQSGGI